MSSIESFLSMVTDINTRIENIGKRVIALQDEIDPERVDKALDKILPQIKGINTRIASLERDVQIVKFNGAPAEFTDQLDNYVTKMETGMISIRSILFMIEREVRARLTHTKG